MSKTDRFQLRMTPKLKTRLFAYADQHPGSASDIACTAIDWFLNNQDAKLVYAVIGPGGRTLRLFGARERAETFVESLGAHLEPSGEWYYVDEDGEPSESGDIRPQEVE